MKGPLTIEGLSVLGRFDIRTLTFVDDDLMLTSPGMSDAWSVVFDTQGNPAISWALPGPQSLPSCAGLLWNPDTRVLYVCNSSRAAGPFRVTASPPIIPRHGSRTSPAMVSAVPTGWRSRPGRAFRRQLLRAHHLPLHPRRAGGRHGQRQPYRQRPRQPDQHGVCPVGELFVGNQGTGTVSRFTFDSLACRGGPWHFPDRVPGQPRRTASTASRMDWIAIPTQTPTSTGSGGSAGTGGSASNDVDGGAGGQAGGLVDADGVGGTGGIGGLPADAGTGGATLFVPDDLANALYRYAIFPGSAPTLSATISVPSAASVALRATGELFVASYAPPGLYKLTSPFGSPTVSGPADHLGHHGVEQVRCEKHGFCGRRPRHG